MTPDTMKDSIKQRLAFFGYKFNAIRDDFALVFLIGKVENTIKNETNLDQVPEGLYHVAVDMVVAEFLKAKKASGDLGDFDYDLNATALTKESQGDTSFSWGADKVMSAEERLDYLIEHLLNYGKLQFLRFRRFVW